MELKIKDADANMRQKLWLAKQNKQFCDCELVAEGRIVVGHRIVLEQASEVLKEAFDKDSKVMLDMKKETLRTIVDLIYLGELGVYQSRVPNLVAALDLLKIDFNREEIEGLMEIPKRRDTTFLESTQEEEGFQQLNHEKKFNIVMKRNKSAESKAAYEDLALINKIVDLSATKAVFPCSNCSRPLLSKAGRSKHEKCCNAKAARRKSMI